MFICCFPVCEATSTEPPHPPPSQQPAAREPDWAAIHAAFGPAFFRKAGVFTSDTDSSRVYSPAIATEIPGDPVKRQAVEVTGPVILITPKSDGGSVILWSADPKSTCKFSPKTHELSLESGTVVHSKLKPEAVWDRLRRGK
jgi:hypothetical protein